MVELIPGGIYKFVNAKGGTTADLSGGDNHSVIGYEDHDGDNQKWIAQPEDDGWTFKNLASGTYLGLQQDPGDDVHVVANEWTSKWIVEDGEVGGSARLLVPGTPFSMDLTNYGSSEPGTKIAVWGRWEAENQCWYINQVGHETEL
ncbi:hypothetical protein ONZ45_g5016 [Pleurotus djamor]|nr:hypothetical protein ONZ45_g5016 [Pleurotus djamor]